MALWSDVNEFKPDVEPLVTDIDSIYQSIENIISTATGQRVFKPWLGSNVEQFLFDIINDDSSLALEHEIIRAIGEWETRIKLVNNLTRVEPDYDNHRYDVTMVFKLKGKGDQQYTYKGTLEVGDVSI